LLHWRCASEGRNTTWDESDKAPVQKEFRGGGSTAINPAWGTRTKIETIRWGADRRKARCNGEDYQRGKSESNDEEISFLARSIEGGSSISESFLLGRRGPCLKRPRLGGGKKGGYGFEYLWAPEEKNLSTWTQRFIALLDRTDTYGKEEDGLSIGEPDGLSGESRTAKTIIIEQGKAFYCGGGLKRSRGLKLIPITKRVLQKKKDLLIDSGGLQERRTSQQSKKKKTQHMSMGKKSRPCLKAARKRKPCGPSRVH